MNIEQMYAKCPTKTICENSMECSEYLNKENIKEAGCVSSVILSVFYPAPSSFKKSNFLHFQSEILFCCVFKKTQFGCKPVASGQP